MSWNKIIFGKLGKTYSGLSGKSGDDFGSGKPFITYMNVFSNGIINPAQTGLVEIRKNEKQNQVKVGDLLFTTSSETIEEVGMTSVLLSDIGEVYLNSFCFGFRLNNFDLLLPEFVPYIFRSERVRHCIALMGQGSTRYNLPKKELLNKLELDVPSKPEQTRIAQILSKADAAIAQTEALIAKYQRIKTGLMQDLLTKGIDECGNIRSEQTHRFKIEKGLRVPEEWEVVELESVCHKIADRDHTTPVYVSDGVFIVSPKDFNELHEIDFSKCQMITLEAHLINRRKTNIEVDDLIFTRIGAGLGKICKVTPEMPEFSILHSACMLKPNQEKILSDFLMYYIKSEFAQKQIVDGIQSIGVPDLGMDKIRTFLVKKPKSLDEQVKVLKPLLKLDNLIRKETAELSKQKSLKTGLMQDLLSGKVRVTINEQQLANS